MKKNKNKFLVIGDPIKHSLSPILHNYWFSKYKINSLYLKKKVKKKNLSKIIRRYKKKNFLWSQCNFASQIKYHYICGCYQLP